MGMGIQHDVSRSMRLPVRRSGKVTALVLPCSGESP
ncbi:hypothetical protein ACP70R_041641 [Stipagrostis hirtigluma subsp. patula]